MERIVIIPEQELDSKISNCILNALKQFHAENNHNEGDKLYTINQVAKLTGKSHAGIRSLVERGVIKTNKANLIHETELRAFLAAK
jgi:hypothetical protein